MTSDTDGVCRQSARNGAGPGIIGWALDLRFDLVAATRVHEGDEPDSVAHLPHAEILSSEDQAEIDLAPPVADAAARRHRGGPVAERTRLWTRRFGTEYARR